ncbi:hypothetical protein SAMN06265218_1255 [Fodinibius sediminis]|uniref:Uncharacterized protein n=1 Tax=Fodinibius sediminis TaxID=1214077 RepID=A0A521F6N4_9BACT|nr:hypothetical protein SAMN06265218_1255 [Fodinibius sediminis]
MGGRPGRAPESLLVNNIPEGGDCNGDINHLHGEIIEGALKKE